MTFFWLTIEICSWKHVNSGNWLSSGRYWCGCWCHNGNTANYDSTLCILIPVIQGHQGKLPVVQILFTPLWPNYVPISTSIVWFKTSVGASDFHLSKCTVPAMQTVCDDASPKVIICFRWCSHRCNKNTFEKYTILRIYAYSLYTFKQLKKK